MLSSEIYGLEDKICDIILNLLKNTYVYKQRKEWSIHGETILMSSPYAGVKAPFITFCIFLSILDFPPRTCTLQLDFVQIMKPGKECRGL